MGKHEHVWQENGSPFKRVCACGRREMLMQRRSPSEDKPSLFWLQTSVGPFEPLDSGSAWWKRVKLYRLMRKVLSK